MPEIIIDRESLVKIMNEIADFMANVDGVCFMGMEIRYNPKTGKFSIEPEINSFDAYQFPICRAEDFGDWLGNETFKKSEVEKIVDEMTKPNWVQQSLSEIMSDMREQGKICEASEIK